MKHFTLRIRIALALAVLAMFVTVTALAREGQQDFILHNQTGVEIHSVFVSPHSAGEWQEDVRTARASRSPSMIAISTFIGI